MRQESETERRSRSIGRGTENVKEREKETKKM